jgi:16S rRNA A1518/A1519 N6-dimethyltransferase RsmA/KsgA/DIM1 with predicted DNA glycosylase/AP lyase activity
LRWGDLCPDCLAEREGRARKLARRISLAATVLMAAYVAIRVSAAPMARLYGAIAILATYIIVQRIATKVAMEYLPK